MIWLVIALLVAFFVARVAMESRNRKKFFNKRIQDIAQQAKDKADAVNLHPWPTKDPHEIANYLNRRHSVR